MIVDVSMYQKGLVPDELPDHVNGIIIKSSQGTYEDPVFPYFLAQVRASKRWRWVGLYHFLSESGPEVEAAYVLNLIDAIGGLQTREFLVLDWENNAITGYSPPMDDARRWMTVVDNALPGRVAWYSYRSNAIKARNSGYFIWPLWLADPNPNGLEWAHTLDAFLLQSGQQTLPMVPGSGNIDVNDVIDISVLDTLGYPLGQSSPLENDMTVQELAAMLGCEVKDGQCKVQALDGNFYSVGLTIANILTELQRSDLLQTRLTQAIVTALPKAGATQLTYDNVLAAVKSALKEQAAILAAN